MTEEEEDMVMGGPAGRKKLAAACEAYAREREREREAAVPKGEVDTAD